MTPAPRRILVVVTQRIGDVLLSTPLLHSLKTAWPGACLDVLVFTGTEGVLEANPDVDRVLTIAQRPSLAAHARLIARLVRRYDLALTTQTGDRPVLYTWLAGRHRIGLRAPRAKEQWKASLLTASAPLDNLSTHTVRMNLTLAALAGIAGDPAVQVHWRTADEAAVRAVLPFDPVTTRYAVLHVSPKFRYKAWTEAGWVALAQALIDEGLQVVLTGGRDPDERATVEALRPLLPPEAIEIGGRLTLSAAGYLLARARVYVGPDTVVTHMAAAVGIPTVALYGPSNPVKWGPWPRDQRGDRDPFVMRGSQHAHNVWLVQGEGECVPCREEGCDRHIGSDSECLQTLTAERVIETVRTALAASAPTSNKAPNGR